MNWGLFLFIHRQYLIYTGPGNKVVSPKVDFMEVLKPYRVRINVIDEQILQLLRRRYDVIEDVAKIKARENIPATIPERVAEVRENAARLAAEKGLDEDFVRKLYTQLIQHSCETEESIMQRINFRKVAR
jgi:chorismate mutase-like protein